MSLLLLMFLTLLEYYFKPFKHFTEYIYDTSRWRSMLETKEEDLRVDCTCVFIFKGSRVSELSCLCQKIKKMMEFKTNIHYCNSCVKWIKPTTVPLVSL